MGGLSTTTDGSRRFARRRLAEAEADQAGQLLFAKAIGSQGTIVERAKKKFMTQLSRKHTFCVTQGETDKGPATTSRSHAGIVRRRSRRTPSHCFSRRSRKSRDTRPFIVNDHRDLREPPQIHCISPLSAEGHLTRCVRGQQDGMSA